MNLIHLKSLNKQYQFLKILSFLFFANFLKAEKLVPTTLMQQEAKWLVQALQQAHFNKVSINELNSTSFITSYLKKLDKQEAAGKYKEFMENVMNKPEMKKFLVKDQEKIIT